MLDAIREVQIPLLAAMLLGGCAAKLARSFRTGTDDGELGATVLFPIQLRRPLTAAICLAEGGLGLGLIMTAGRIGAGLAAASIRIGSFLLFVVATCALFEMRQTRPEAGCGCFGDLSSAPVSGRSLARSALLAAAALSTIGLPPIARPRSAAAAIELIVILVAELIVIGLLSPEIGEGLIRLGYSEPCELRAMSVTRAAAALHRSRAWRRYSSLRAADVPADSWRELCWHYLVYPAFDPAGRPAELVFAVYLQHRRPAIRAALVDGATGAPLPLPAPRYSGPRWIRLWPGPASAQTTDADDSVRLPGPATQELPAARPAAPREVTPRLVQPGPATSARIAEQVSRSQTDLSGTRGRSDHLPLSTGL